MIFLITQFPNIFWNKISNEFELKWDSSIKFKISFHTISDLENFKYYSGISTRNIQAFSEIQDEIEMRKKEIKWKLKKKKKTSESDKTKRKSDPKSDTKTQKKTQENTKTKVNKESQNKVKTAKKQTKNDNKNQASKKKGKK